MVLLRYTKAITCCLILYCFLLPAFAIAQKAKVTYTPELTNTRHPLVGYWFITPETLEGDAYLKQLEEYAQTTPYTLIFLTARDGVDFFDVETMHPVLERLVAKADSLNIGVGLQIWHARNYTEENCSRTIVETETKLDANGSAVCRNKPRNVRMAKPFKHELLRAYAFQKCDTGTYKPGSLSEITHLCMQKGDNNEFQIEISAGRELAGYDVYVMSEIYYEWPTLFADYTLDSYYRVLKAYSDIPFKGIGFDEFGYMAVQPGFLLKSTNEDFRIRHYSLAMKEQYYHQYNRSLDEDLFKMCYSPEGNDTEKIKAKNFYMDVMRHGPLRAEKALARFAKTLYGPEVFLGLHNTFHNDFDEDEIWSTGINWWTLPRDYGHSDENTATAIQTGIGMANTQNVMYNMYYHRNLDTFASKALTDLQYGIRTHYHAINDKGTWGISLETPEVAPTIRKVERMAKLLNHFNATYADCRILVIAGMEALANWYPDYEKRGKYDINSTLKFQEKVREMWNAGYLNALVSTDLIENDLLTLNQENKPMMNGHVFEAIVLLNPQYAKPKTADFIKRYVDAGGKLLVEGEAQKDFYANDIREWQKEIVGKAVATHYSLENVAKLGIPPNNYKNGNRCTDGAVIVTDYPSLKNNSRTDFSITVGNHVYTGKYQGMVALDVDEQGKVKRLACGAFDELFRNGKSILKIKSPADIVLTTDKQGMKITVIGSQKKNEILYNE